MKFTVLTLFPEVMKGYFENGLMRRALEKGIVSYELLNIRDYSTNKHKTVDDYPFGGGAGMVLSPEPLGRALATHAGKRIVYLTPRGKKFEQSIAEELSREDELIFICGHYEGIDQRIIDSYVTDEISLGDFILSGGEIGTLAVIDATTRLVDGALSSESLHEESFTSGLLEYSQYTRPREYEGIKVPDILLSGNHKLIEEHRLNESIRLTLERRPDLIEAGLENGVFDKTSTLRLKLKNEIINSK